MDAAASRTRCCAGSSAPYRAVQDSLGALTIGAEYLRRSRPCARRSTPPSSAPRPFSARAAELAVRQLPRQLHPGGLVTRVNNPLTGRVLGVVTDEASTMPLVGRSLTVSTTWRCTYRTRRRWLRPAAARPSSRRLRCSSAALRATALAGCSMKADVQLNPLTLLWGDAMVGVRLHRIQGDLRSRQAALVKQRVASAALARAMPLSGSSSDLSSSWARSAHGRGLGAGAGSDAPAGYTRADCRLLHHRGDARHRAHDGADHRRCWAVATWPPTSPSGARRHRCDATRAAIAGSGATSTVARAHSSPGS